MVFSSKNSYAFLYAFAVLVPSTPAVTKKRQNCTYAEKIHSKFHCCKSYTFEDRQNCTYAEKIHSNFHCCESCTFVKNTQKLDVYGVAHPCWRCTTFGVVTRVAHSPKTSRNWMLRSFRSWPLLSFSCTSIFVHVHPNCDRSLMYTFIYVHFLNVKTCEHPPDQNFGIFRSKKTIAPMAFKHFTTKFERARKFKFVHVHILDVCGRAPPVTPTFGCARRNGKRPTTC